MLPLKYTFKALWLLDVFPKVLFTLLNCCWSLMICFYVSALRDNRIELVRASWKELTISINDVTLSDEGQYTCSLFTMPVKTSKAFLTVLGKTSRRSVPSHPHQSVLLRSTHSSLIWGQWALSRHMILFLHFGGTGSDVNERISHWLMERLDVSLCALVYDQLVLESEALTLNTVCLYTTFTFYIQFFTIHIVYKYMYKQ